MTTFSQDFDYTRGTGATRVNAAGLIVGVDFSSTSNTVTTGSKTFTLAADLNVNRDWTIGEDVRVIDQVSGNVMLGTVTSYTPSTQELVLNIASVTGSGTFTNWRIGSLEARKDAVTGAFISEGAASNLLIRSNDFANAQWVKSNTTIETGAVNLFGSVGVKLTENTANAQHQINYTITQAAPYTISVYAKNAGRRYLTVSRNTNTATSALFDLQTGTIVIAPTSGTATITPMIDGWYRLTFTDAVNSLATILFFLSDGTSLFPGYTGDGVSGVHIFQAGLESGTSVTSPIPTTTVAVTRNADTSAFSALSLSKIGSRGAAFFELQSDDIGATQKRALRLTGPTGELRLVKRSGNAAGNYTKMAEGSGLRLLGNSIQGMFDDGLGTTAFNPIDTRTGVAVGAFNLPSAVYNGANEFGVLSTLTENTVNQTFTTYDGKGLGGSGLNGCHHNGSRFIISTAVSGLVILSTDGLSYRRVNTPVITQACNEVTSGMVGPILRNVIVGLVGFIATSDDNGETWVSRTSGTTNSLTAVSYGLLSATNYFIVTGSNQQLRYSTDAITWTNGTGQANVSYQDVHIANGIAVAVATGGVIFTSTNGTSWTASASSGVTTTQQLNGVHYNASANLWVAVGNAGTIITATDPTGTWTLQTSGTGANLFEVNYFNNLWIVVGNGTTLVTSPNGSTWTPRNITASVSGTLNGVAASATRLIITGGTGAFASSEDGLTYTSRTNNNATLNGIAYGNGVYVSVGNAVNGSGYIATIDGAGTVTRRVSGTTSSVLNARFLNGAFYTPTGATSQIIRSVDGATWSLTTVNGTIAAQDITYTGSIFVVCGNGGRFTTSTDGLTFVTAAQTGVTTQNLTSIDFANGAVVAVGAAGTIITGVVSGTTVIWTLRTSGTTANLTSVMYSTRDNRWYAAGNSGTLLYSEDNGVTWYPVTNSAYVGVTDSGLQSSLILPPLRTGVNRMAISWDTNNVKLSCNGVTVSDTLATIPMITAGSIAENLNGQVRKFRQYSYALTDAELNALTGV